MVFKKQFVQQIKRLLVFVLTALVFSNSIFANNSHIYKISKDSLSKRQVGLVDLNPSIPFAEQVGKKNTVYVIHSSFDLKGQAIVIPEGCILSFKGGMIRNGVLVGNNTSIEAAEVATICLSVLFDGTWNVEIGYPEWFGAIGNGIVDDRVAVQKAISLCKTIVLNKDYLIHNAPFDYRKYKTISDDELDYYLDILDQKNRTPNSSLTPLVVGSNKTLVVAGTLKAYSPLGNLIELRGNNSVITGGGGIIGCGLVNTVNVYSGVPSYKVTNWEAALIYIKGSNNRIDNLTIKNPTRQGISIDDYKSSGNMICNNIIGGGLISHTKDIKTCSFTGLFGVYARGTNTIVQGNVFKRLDGRCLYDALYCNYTTTNVPSIEKRTDIHTIFENNYVEDALEHGVYSYASNLRIIGNTIHSDYTALQLFNGQQLVDNNIIHGNPNAIGIYVSGENQVITNNKIYNTGRYAIRCGGYYNGSCDNDYVANNYIEKVMASFSKDQPKTTPAISFESTLFQDNKLNLNKITCENNTVVCIGEAQSARTIPIIGIIAIYGDSNTTIDQINIVNNTVINSNVADNIGITLMNPIRRSVALVDGNNCINNNRIISTTPNEPVLKVHGVKKLIVRNNHLEQKSTTGTAFELTEVDIAEMSGNTLYANVDSKSVFYYSGKDTFLGVDGSNIINGQAVEQRVVIPSNTTSPVSVNMTLPDNRWDLLITPVNRSARRAESNNPIKILKSDIHGVQLYHEKATASPTEYRIKVIYK